MVKPLFNKEIDKDILQCMQNVHPVPVVDSLGQTAIAPGLTLLDYHVASAPPMPDWFKSKLEIDNQEGRREVMTDFEMFVLWRLTYAKSMILGRNIFFESGKIPGNDK